MTDNTANVLMFALMILWNALLWAAFLFMVTEMEASYWILIIPICFTVFPDRAKRNERPQSTTE
jgi:cytochrome c oxidase subunit IV